MEKSKIHKIIVQVRRPICMGLVLAIVFIYGLTASADTGNTFVDLGTYYNISDSGSTPFFWPTMKQSYINEGNDLSKLTYVVLPNNETTYAYMQLGTYNKLFPEQVLQSAITGYENNLTTVNLVNTFTRDSVPYDFTNAYTLIFAESYSWSFPAMIMRCKGSGSFAVVDGYLVSDQNFSYITYYAGDYNNASGITPGTCSVAGADGFYKVFLQDFYNAYGVVSFTDLDIYFSSTDASSGFTEGNFDFGGRSGYYNFNFLKTGGFIVSPADPQPEPIGNNMGANYTYAGVEGWFSSVSASSVKINFSLNLNSFMRLHPEEYVLHYGASCVIDTGGDTSHFHIDTNYEVPDDFMSLADILYSDNADEVNNSSYSSVLPFSFFTDQSGNSLDYALPSLWSSYTNASSGYYIPDGSIISYGGTGAGGSRSFGGYDLNTGFGIEDMVFYGYCYIEWIGGEPEQNSGFYRWHQSMFNGSRNVDANDITQNFNPPESYSDQYPSSINTSGSSSGSSGSGNWKIELSNDINAQVEYLYNLDASDFNNIAGNSTNALQNAVNFVTGSGDNGFGAFLNHSFGLIPGDIMDWVKATVGVLLGGAILGWVYNGVRIKRG